VPYIYPGPSLMKLDNLRDVNKNNFFLNKKLSFDTRNRSSYSVKSELLCTKPIKVKACFLLNFSNVFSIKELDEKQSFAVLMQSSFKSNPMFSSKESDLIIDAKISNLISNTKVFIMNRKKGHNITNKLVNFIESLNEQ